MIICSLETFATEFFALVRLRTKYGNEWRGIEINPKGIALNAYRLSYSDSRF